MEQYPPNIAVMIFALNPAEDAARKDMGNSRQLFQKLTQHTLKEVKKTGLPYFNFQGKQQGQSFGERFTNALAALFYKGFDQVIAIGNDCPQLNHHHLLLAAQSLARGNNSIAPALDGGFNLLGIQKSTFNKATWQALPWQTPSLLDSVLAQFKALDQQIDRLPQFADVDNLQDVFLIQPKLKRISLALYQAFLALLAVFSAHCITMAGRIQQAITPLPYNKGSPLTVA